MIATSSCPYCNAVVAIPAGTRDGQFVPCPRCGERFPYHGLAIEGNGTPPAPAEPGGQPAGENVVDRVGERLRGASKRSIALVVVGVMLVMAAGGLTLALATQHFRRTNDRPPPPDEGATRVRVVAPPDLAGIGYLPADTDIVAAVHLAEALQDPAGQEFLKRFRPEGAVRDQPGQGPALAGDLEHWTGLALDDLDHVVLGLKVGGGALPPRTVLVAQTRRRYDADKVLKALKATRLAQSARELYRFHLERPPLQPVLWFAGERTLVVALTPEQLAEVPENPPPGAEHLAAPLREMLRTRLGPGVQAWAVGHADDWERTTAKVPLAFLREPDRRVLEGVRTFGVALRFGEGLTLTGACHCADAAAARALEERLAPPAGSDAKRLALLDAGQAGPVGRELAQSLKVVREDDWLTLQAKANPSTVGAPPRTTARGP
jgi:hypothetical protein